MKLTVLLSMNDQLKKCRPAGAQAFRLYRQRRPPYLMEARRREIGPVFTTPSTPPPQRTEPGRATSRAPIERLLVWGAVALFCLLSLYCGLGAQRITHTQQRASLARQLHQREAELHTAQQARRSLESLLAVQTAQTERLLLQSRNLVAKTGKARPGNRG
jgi:hypothetical protein